LPRLRRRPTPILGFPNEDGTMRYERVLITGGTGRIGRYVVEELASQCAVTVLTRNPERFQGRLAGIGVEVELARGDVTDPAGLLEILKGHDAVVHIAGLDFDTTSKPQDYIAVNTIGTWIVLEAAREAKVRRVVVDSSFRSLGVSELRPDFPPHYLPIDDEHPRRPSEGYGVSKALQEEVCYAFTHTGEMSVICLRPPTVLFPSKVPEMIEMASNPNTRSLFAYVSPEDIATAHRLALEAEGTQYEAMIISSADSCRDEPILDAAERIIGRLPPTRKPALYQDDPHASLVSSRRARESIGFEPTSSWSAIRDAWLAEN
jgi:nucleoside-diphosphate-sugar epimerase